MATDPPEPDAPRFDPLFEPGHRPAVDPRDAAAVVHRFLRRCRAWGAEREVPARLARLQAAPDLKDAASLHQWVAWVAFIDHALAEIEAGKLDDWFTDADRV
ncbi:MAG: hypothetical protein R3F59_04570 [Myxococcota bacterium]